MWAFFQVEKDVEVLLNENVEREKTNAPRLLSSAEKAFAERYCFPFFIVLFTYDSNLIMVKLKMNLCQVKSNVAKQNLSYRRELLLEHQFFPHY